MRHGVEEARPNPEESAHQAEPVWLRRLRFPPSLERAFAADYSEKILPWIRSAMLLLLALTTLFWMRDAPSGASPTVYVVSGSLMALMLLVTLNRWCVRLWQPTMCLLGGMICWMVFGHVARNLSSVPANLDAWHREDSFLMSECLALIGALILTRLWFGWLSLLGWSIVLLGMVISVNSLGIDPALALHRNAATLFPAMAVFMFSGYVQERSARGEFLAKHRLAEERARAEKLLLNILPASVAERLKHNPATIADTYAEVTVLFADVVDFTPLAAGMKAEEVVHLLNTVFTGFDGLCECHGLEKIKTIGDAYMVVGGMPEARADHVEAIAEMALQMQAQIGGFTRDNGAPLMLRIGIHTGPVVAGVIGTRKFSYDLWGDTVNVASRMESQGTPGHIQVTEAVRMRLGDKYVFGAGRDVNVKGRGVVSVYPLLGRQP